MLSLDKYNESALSGIVSGRKFSDKDDGLIKKIYEILDRKKSPALLFALGKIYNDLGEYDQAFLAYKSANDIRNRRTDYNEKKQTEYVDSIISIFTKQLITDLQYHGNASELPVFIIGTPRSGTTLTEQIISSHHAVFGAGELKYIGELAANRYRIQHTDKKYPDRIPGLSSYEISEEANIYLDKIRQYQNDSIVRITDKMPANFFYVGYISILFPDAKIIHCRRNPLDACLSIYFQSFHAEQQYSFDLANLGNWYKDYIRLMGHWNNVMNGRILNIDYDETVNNTETTAQKLIDYCGLEWDPKCIEFYKTSRGVQTASQWQVRQPIYKTSLQRWKRYDKHIGVLKEILEGYY